MVSADPVLFHNSYPQISISTRNPGLLATAIHLSVPFTIASQSFLQAMETSLPQTIAKHLANEYEPSLLSPGSNIDSAMIHDYMTATRTLAEYNDILATRCFLVGNGTLMRLNDC